MKNIIKLIVIAIFFSIPIAYAQEGCVIPPMPAYETNQACVYSSYSGTYDPADPCYQKYLQLKSDYAAKCKVYWDNKKTQSNQSAPTVAPQVIEVIKEVVVTPTSIPVKWNYNTFTPTETPTPTSKSLTITPSADDYYEETTQLPQKQSFIQILISNFTSFFNRLFFR